MVINKKPASNIGVIFLIVGGFLILASFVYLFVVVPLDSLYADLGLQAQYSGFRKILGAAGALLGLVLFFIGYKEIKPTKGKIIIFVLSGIVVFLIGYTLLHLDDRLKGQREANEAWYKNVYPTVQQYQNNSSIAPTQ